MLRRKQPLNRPRLRQHRFISTPVCLTHQRSEVPLQLRESSTSTFSPTEMSGTSENDDFDLQFKSEAEDGTDYGGAAVLVIKNGKILCASRRSSEGICGPGGHIEDGETPEEAALREAQEEFNIVPLNILPLGVYKSRTGSYCDSMIYFTDQFTGFLHSRSHSRCSRICSGSKEAILWMRK